jgi:hypothetical protein
MRSTQHIYYKNQILKSLYKSDLFYIKQGLQWTDKDKNEIHLNKL